MTSASATDQNEKCGNCGHKRAVHYVDVACDNGGACPCRGFQAQSLRASTKAPKKLSTAMLTALAIAHSQGEVLVGDDQRVAMLGMAGKVTAATITALYERGLLALVRRIDNFTNFELTADGLRALADAGVISAEEYDALRLKWSEWMDVTHAEALDMDEKREIVRAALSVPTGVELSWDLIEQTVSRLWKCVTPGTSVGDAPKIERSLARGDRSDLINKARALGLSESTMLLDTEDLRVCVEGPASGATYSRALRNGPEVVRVDTVDRGKVWFRFVRKDCAPSALYSLRLNRFVERYSRVPA